jgi:hypothetical protein
MQIISILYSCQRPLHLCTTALAMLMQSIKSTFTATCDLWNVDGEIQLRGFIL